MPYHLNMSGDLKRKAVSGMLWSSFQKFGTMGISFVSNIILARLLTPEDYGCIGMLMIFILVANTFIDGGFGSALIQKKEPTQEDYSTIFYWNLFLSVVLYFALFASAPLIARFYNLPLLSSVLQVQGLVLILNSLSIIQQNRLRKQLLFKKLAIVSIISALLSLAITIYLAYLGCGAWALVAQQLLMSGFNAVLYWIVGKWNPSLVFSRQSFKELFGFGGFILLSNLINTFCNNMQGLIIGRFCSARALGLYTQSVKLVDVSSMSISSVIDQVSYPILSGFQNDRERLVATLRNIIMATAYISFPIVSILILIAKPLIVLLYSEKWIECVPYFQILCIAGFVMCIQNINYYGVAALGKSKTLFTWTIVKRILGLMAIILGFVLNDFIGILWGFVVSAFIVYVINASLSAYYTGYRLLQQLKDLFPVILLTATVHLIIFGAVDNFVSAWEGLSMYVSMFVELFVYVLLYLLLSFLFKLQAFKSIISLLDNFKSKR